MQYTPENRPRSFDMREVQRFESSTAHQKFAAPQLGAEFLYSLSRRGARSYTRYTALREVKIVVTAPRGYRFARMRPRSLHLRWW